MAPDESEQPAPKREPRLGARHPHGRQRGPARGPHHQDRLRRRAPEGAPPLDARLLRRWRCSRPRSASCSRPGAGSRCSLAFDAHVPLRALTGHYFAGQFVGNVLPSTIGGDVLRVSRSAKHIGSSETAFAAVALERLTGFLALPVICFFGFLVDPSLLESSTAWVALLVAGDRARRARRDPAPRRAPEDRRPLQRPRELDAVHRRGATSASTACARDRAPRSRVLGTAIIYQVSVVLDRRLRDPHARRAGAGRRGDRVRPRRRDGPGGPDLAQRARRPRRACSCCCSTRSASPTARPSASACSGTSRCCS